MTHQPPLTPQEFHATLCTTDTYAGGFFRSLAAALRSADPTNRQRLLAAFPEIVATYGPGSSLYRRWSDTQARQRVEGLLGDRSPLSRSAS